MRTAVQVRAPRTLFGRDHNDSAGRTDLIYACHECANAAVVITEWDEFRALDLERVKSALANPILVDMCNL
jgi:UDP-glucose 6-dehydrogenase